MKQWLAECWTLSCRNLRIIFSDSFSLGTLLLQAPLIAGLTLLAFSQFEKDDAEANHFVRVVYHFRALADKYEKAGETVPVYEKIIPETQAAVAKETRLLSVAAAQRRAALYFVLISAAIWMGIMGSCREIVGERDVLVREFHSCVRVGPFLWSKLLTQSLLAGWQTGALTGIVHPMLLADTPGSGWALWLTLWATATTTASLGLLVSGLARNTRVALTLVPILMVPQLLLGGLLRPPAHASGVSVLRTVCEHLTAQRWGFQAALETDRCYATGGIVSIRFNGFEFTERYAELNMVRSSETNLVSVFFKDDQPSLAWMPAMVRRTNGAVSPFLGLWFLTSVFFLGTYWALKVYFIRT